jgi:hypothetical protein
MTILPLPSLGAVVQDVLENGKDVIVNFYSVDLLLAASKSVMKSLPKPA